MRAAFLEEMMQRSCAANPFVDKDTLRAEALAKKMGTKVSIRKPVAPLVYNIQFDGKFCAVPSKAFLETQAERGQAERDKAERERAERELAKRRKHQSYEDFAPISISELDRALVVVNIDPIFRPKCQLQNVKLKNFVREEFQRTCYPIYDKVMAMVHLIYSFS